MKAHVLAVCIVTLFVSPRFAQLPNLLNPGFEEEGPYLGAPLGWRFGATPGYLSVTTNDSCYSGTQCGMVQSSSVHTPDNHAFLYQNVDARPYRGRRLTFRAAVRAKVAGPDGARLLVRIHQSDGSSCFFDNMADRPITSAQWNFYQITADACDDAVDLEVGMQLWGDGSAWIDDASLEI